MNDRGLLAAGCPLLLSGCSGLQSALDPYGIPARQVAELSWVLFVSGVLIFALVVVLAICALWLERRSWIASPRFVVAAGVIFPVVTLTALLVYAFTATNAGVIGGEQSPIRIEVVGEQWWWRVRYPDENVVTANEIHIPVGRSVDLALSSADVIHSFWVPNLAGKLDMIPGRVNTFRFSAERAGTFRGQCAEYCGGPHAQMAFYVIAQTPEAYARWIARERNAAADPADEFRARGQRLFLGNSCAVCHAIRGTPADGQLGPDLTHVGARMSLGAGILPNNPGTMAAWITSSQHLKPDNRMPSFNVYTGEELRALAAYLDGLR